MDEVTREEPIWQAHPGAQEKFLSCPAFEVLFGGAAGPGKTDCLLMGALRQIHFPDYRALLLRRTFAELQKADSLIDRSYKWFPRFNAKYNSQQKRWTFPSGATIEFGHMEYEDSKYNYQTAQYAYIGFDELCTFTEGQYTFLISRCRSPNPKIRKYIRAGTNPIGIGHLWVKARFIDIGFPYKIHKIPLSEGRTITRCFIPGTLHDNPSLTDNDPDYITRLMMLSEKEQRALIHGDWDVFEGQYFNEWDRNIHIVPAPEEAKDKKDKENYNEIIGIDYGYKNPASIGWYRIGVDGKPVRYKELYKEKLTYAELAYEILQNTTVNPEYAVADPSIWGDRSHHKGAMVGESGGETMANIFSPHPTHSIDATIRKERRKRGIPKHISFTLIQGDNNRVTGWGRCREYLKPYKDQHGKKTALFGVTKNCLNFIRTLPGMIHSKTKPEDLNTHGEDHCADEFRYVVMARPERSKAEIKEDPVSTYNRDKEIMNLCKKQTTEKMKRSKEQDIIGM